MITTIVIVDCQCPKIEFVCFDSRRAELAISIALALGQRTTLRAHALHSHSNSRSAARMLTIGIHGGRWTSWTLALRVTWDSAWSEQSVTRVRARATVAAANPPRRALPGPVNRAKA